MPEALLVAPAAVAIEPREFAFHDRDFRRVCRLIHALAGIQLGPHKRDMVYGRLVRRLRACAMQRFADYLDLVESECGTEIQQFVNALTTNLTSFFREEYHFDALARQLQEARRDSLDRNLLIWCCAASTGEEPYSLAMTACEAFDTLTPPVRILATDIDTNALRIAAQGVYAMERIEVLDATRRRRFFQRGSGPNHGQCRVRPALQALVDFRPLNLHSADYGLRGDHLAVFCRNVMIYFDKPTQYRVLQRIVPLLAADGRLYAGHSESFNHATDLITPCGRTTFRATASAVPG